MTSTGADRPETVRLLDSGSATSLARLAERFEDLQTVLRCCEGLVTELAEAGSGEPDDVLVESLWTCALLSYARCFGDGEDTLTEDDVATAVPGEGVREWHRVLLQLRDHYADTSTNPRERFSVGVAQDDNGSASGLALTSTRQPRVDDLTVRQTGAVAYALSGLVDERITARQEEVFEEVKATSRSELDDLALLEIAETSATP